MCETDNDNQHYWADNRHYWAKTSCWDINDAIAFLPSNDTQCLQTNMRISARSENRVSTWITQTNTQKSRTPGRGIDFPCSVFKASMSYRAAAIGVSNVRSIKSECVFLARFLRILARFGTRAIQFGRLRPGGFWSRRQPCNLMVHSDRWEPATAVCSPPGIRLTNDDDHLHRSPLFIHMNETLNLLTVQLLLFCYSRSSIGLHEILHRESTLLAPTITLIICHSRHFASLTLLLCWRYNVILSRFSLEMMLGLFSQRAAFLTRSVIFNQSSICAQHIVLRYRNGNKKIRETRISSIISL